ncbi:hypothetical protein SDC9_145709 [bioreactor metagenome]|uniref:Uncharacterized protein n=1 Tax=bioreactor metagenome TaxID=1076179 RepID=A0A645EB06_9ZZZZ
MHVGGGAAEFQRERGRDDDFRWCRDAGELRVHLRADVLELDCVHRLPSLRIFGEDDAQQALDDALLGGGEITPLDPGMEAAVAAEHVVDDQEDQIGVEDKQRRAAQRLGRDQIQVGRDDQVADELAVFLHADRADRDFRVTVHIVEEADAQVTGETLVDQLQRRHPAADDALLSAQVVGTNPGFVPAAFFRIVGFPSDALEQGVNFVLGEKVASHGSLLDDERSEQHRDYRAFGVNDFALLVLGRRLDRRIDFVHDLASQLFLAFLG